MVRCRAPRPPRPVIPAKAGIHVPPPQWGDQRKGQRTTDYSAAFCTAR